MTKFWMILMAMICAAMFSVIGCDDDEDGDDDDDDAAEGEGGDEGEGDGEGGGEMVDPLADMDCEGAGADTTQCDYLACSYATAIESIESMDCGVTPEMQTYCDDVLACYVDYVGCLTDACPAGTAIADADIDAYTACADTVTTCATSVTMPTK